MHKIVTAVLSAYAAVAALSFALGFLLAPAKAQAGEGEAIAGEVSPYSLFRWRQEDAVTAGTDGLSARMRLRDRTGSVRIGSVKVPAVERLDPQNHKNFVVISGAAVDEIRIAGPVLATE